MSAVRYYSADFPLSGNRNYVVEEFSAKHQSAIISCSQPKVRGVVGIPCQFFNECTPNTFKQKATINNILISELWNCPKWPQLDN